jgi:hypothetical protein
MRLVAQPVGAVVPASRPLHLCAWSYCADFPKSIAPVRERFRPANRPPSVATLCVGPLCVPAVCRLCVAHCVDGARPGTEPAGRICRAGATAPEPPGRRGGGALGPSTPASPWPLSQSAAVGGAIPMGSKVFPPAQRETGRDGMMRVLLVGMTNDALSGRRVGLGTAANFDLAASAGVRFRAAP